MSQADTRMETVEIIKSHFGCCPDGIRKIENELIQNDYNIIEDISELNLSFW